MFEIVFLSSPAVSGVFSSVQEAKKAMNALMIYLQRYLEKENIEKVRTECVVSCTSSHTGEEVSPHLHILIMAVNHVSKIANAVIEYLSSRHSSVKNPAKGLRIYKTFHDAGNYANLHRYLQKQARYQRAFEKNFGEYLESYLMEERILQIDNPKTGIDYQDDFSRALNIERAQLLLNEEKKRCEFYQLQHQNEIFENPVLLGPEECDVISAYENGLERVCIYFPEVVRYSIEDESFNEENYFSEETEICDCFPDDESTSICTENPTTEDVSGSQRDEIVLDETDSSGISTPVYDEKEMKLSWMKQIVAAFLLLFVMKLKRQRMFQAVKEMKSSWMKQIAAAFPLLFMMKLKRQRMFQAVKEMKSSWMKQIAAAFLLQSILRILNRREKQGVRMVGVLFCGM